MLWYTKVNIWKKENYKSLHTFSRNLSNKITEVEEKLDKLINAFLDDLIDKETYLNKKNELIKTKTDLL